MYTDKTKVTADERRFTPIILVLIGVHLRASAVRFCFAFICVHLCPSVVPTFLELSDE
jgi:hypothetical protein